MGLSHYPRARKQLFLVRETDNCCCSQLPLRNWDLRWTNPFSFTYKRMRLATTPACHVLLLVRASNSFCHMLPLLNILKMLFCPAMWQPQRKAAREKQVWKVERGLQVSRLSFWNFSYAPKQTKDVPHPQTLPSCCLPTFTSTAESLAQLEQSWGCSFLCHPEQPPVPAQWERGPRAHTQAAQPHLPMSSWWLCCLYSTPAPTGNPHKTHYIGLLVSQCCLRWEKQLQGREGVSPNVPCYIHRTVVHQKCPVTKAISSMMEK